MGSPFRVSFNRWRFFVLALHALPSTKDKSVGVFFIKWL